MQVRTAAVAVVVLRLAVAAIVAAATTGMILAVCSLVVLGWAVVGLVKPSWGRLPNRIAALGVWALWIGLVVVSLNLTNQPNEEGASAPIRLRPDRATPAPPPPVLVVETAGNLLQERTCPEPGQYYVRAVPRGDTNSAIADPEPRRWRERRRGNLRHNDDGAARRRYRAEQRSGRARGRHVLPAEHPRPACVDRPPARNFGPCPEPVPITVRLSPALKRQLDEHARTLGLATGTYVQSLIESALQQESEQDGKLT